MNMLTAKETALIKESWISLREIDPVIISDTFYRKLFYDNPELRKMFPEKLNGQYQKLTDMLNSIIERIDNLDKLKGEITNMARRHVDYGVRPEHYNMVGTALLWTLQRGLGNEWTKEVKSAWINCYSIISGTMITASGK